MNAGATQAERFRAEVAELERGATERLLPWARNRHAYLRGWLDGYDARQAPQATHNAEEALRAIRDHGKTDEFPCHAIADKDCIDVLREIARSALDRVGK